MCKHAEEEFDLKEKNNNNIIIIIISRINNRNGTIFYYSLDFTVFTGTIKSKQKKRIE
jgi:hypothetical protein